MIAKKEAGRLARITDYERVFWESGILYVAGVDEVGRGPLAGPVVTACVVMPPYPLVEGVKDSKTVKNEANREALYTLILRQALDYGIGVVDNEEIDRINILAATRKAVGMAVNRLQHPPQHVLTDYVHGLELAYPHTMLKKGDALSYCVAAASLVAKVTRDRMMRAYAEAYPQYAFDRNKGYCTRAHEEAIRQNGLCPLHRRSFCRKFENV